MDMAAITSGVSAGDSGIASFGSRFEKIDVLQVGGRRMTKCGIGFLVGLDAGKIFVVADCSLQHLFLGLVSLTTIDGDELLVLAHFLTPMDDKPM